MRKLLFVGLTLFVSSLTVSAEINEPSNHAGQCFALFEFSRQVTEDPQAKSIFEEARKRAGASLIRLKTSEGYSFDTTSENAFNNQMKELLMHYSQMNRTLTLDELNQLWDQCEVEFL
ncbi:hypothetical protein [Marinospirillum perlucidum]|uniref:hypothetical protein n=1 Tax=Marinospirillum perlucidum TaxID=1982602 RepID=UPI000DF45333|nr:hypothetical protein [Marinospirillum perlucidum]